MKRWAVQMKNEIAVEHRHRKIQFAEKIRMGDNHNFRSGKSLWEPSAFLALLANPVNHVEHPRILLTSRRNILHVRF